MEYKSDETSYGGCSLNAPDKIENAIKNEVSELNRRETDGKDIQNPVLSPPGDLVQVNLADGKVVENVVRDAPLEEMEISGEINMEAYITTDDVMRAGGFGARDDIGCFLPVASILPTLKLLSVMPETMKNHRGRYADQVLDGQKVRKQSSFVVTTMFKLLHLTFIILRRIMWYAHILVYDLGLFYREISSFC